MDPEIISDDLFEEGALTEEQTPEATPEQKRQAVEEYFRANPHVNPVVAPVAPVQAPVAPAPSYQTFGGGADPGDENVPDDETIVQAIERVVRKSIAPIQQQFTQQYASTGAIAGEGIVNSIATQYGLTPEEVKEARAVVGRIDPVQLTNIYSNEDAKKEIAALARGRASFNAPPTPASAVRTSSSIKWAPGVTEEDLRRYMQFQGIEKLRKEDLATLKKEGYIVN